MAEIPLGARGRLSLLVTGDYATSFMGDDAARVLATPFVIGYLELAARQAILGYHDPGYDSVGTEVNVRHFAAAPLGMSVAFHAEVTGVDGRRVTFRVWAEDELERIAEGTHERFVLNVERFADRLRAKSQRRSA